MRRVVLLLAGFSVAGATVLGDVVRLKDGASVEGDVKRAEGGGWVVTLADGQVMALPEDRVKSIEAGVKAGGVGGDMAGLASLRRASENQADVGQVIEKYKRFIGQAAGTPAGEEAKKDLVVWEDRLERGMVRVGTRWVTKDEQGKLALEAVQLADGARRLIKDGKWQEAQGPLAEALKVDPQSATALYLRALSEYQGGQYVAARKDLEVVKGETPGHGPTLNNLAVIAVRQNRMGEAVNYLDQAMRASPGDRVVMDNAAEVLHAVTEETARPNVQRNLLQRAVVQFQEQDAKLAAKMKEQGLNRWGATWVNDADYAKLQAAQKQVEEKTAAIQTEYESTQRAIAGIDDRIAGDEATLRQLESQSYRQDVRGFLVQVPLPPVYYDIQRDIQDQRVARQQAAAKLEGLSQQAQTIQRELPVPKYKGELHVVGADGAPIVLAPTTAPRPGT